MGKKIWIGFVVTYIITEVLDYLINGVLLGPTYDWLMRSFPGLYRPEGMKIYIFFITNIFFSFFFVYIFSRGYEGKGVLEGVRYGLYIALMVTLPAAYAEYAMHPLPYSFGLKWFLCGTAEYMIAGAVLAMIFGSARRPAPAS
ncbi:MAG TPA: hypothetical protein VMW43_02460 [Bacteroidota bacterium]|nr:hypothetical protein [Bacteroidota bacterium]